MSTDIVEQFKMTRIVATSIAVRLVWNYDSAGWNWYIQSNTEPPDGIELKMDFDAEKGDMILSAVLAKREEKRPHEWIAKAKNEYRFKSMDFKGAELAQRIIEDFKLGG